MKNIQFSLFFKMNLLLTLILFLGFLTLYTDYTLLSFFLAILASISTAVTLYMIFYLLLFFFTFSKNLILYLASFIFILTNFSLVLDFFIYKLFHFHINAMVLNIIMSPDAQDSIQIGLTPIVFFISVILGLIGFEFVLIKKIKTLDHDKKSTLNSMLNKMIILPFIMIVFSEKIAYGFASLFSEYKITSTLKVIPLYQALTFTSIADKYFGFKAEAQAKYSIQTKGHLAYPLQPLEVNQTVQRFNIFIIASDSFKYSVLTQDNTPNLKKFEQDSLSFNHHYSGGNSTRFGIFSLFYGLNPTYWFSFFNAHQKPIFFDVLKKLDYKINIFSSTNTNWPEFRKTCYVDIQDSIQDNFKGVPWEKDEQSSQALIKNIQKYTKDKFYFSFLFLDAPHGYSYPPSHNKYQAQKSTINHLGISKKSKEIKSIRQNYKNAIYYNDMLFGKIITKLKEKNLYENALIIFTSDHGEEFFEQGNFGHNTAFSDAQVHIPFLLKLPKFLQNKDLKNNINTSLTSHQDVVPSLLSLLGVTNSPTQYSNGKNFFAKDFKRNYVFASNWNSNAIITKKKVYVFSNMPNKIFNNEIRDKITYKESSPEPDKVKFILDTIQQNKKFLKP